MDQPEKDGVKFLREQAKEFGIDCPPNLVPGERMDKLKLDITHARMKKRIVEEEKVRAEIRAAAEIKRRVADVEAEARLNHVEVTIPSDPTLADVVRLEKQLKMKVAEPKPSPETLAIRASKKVYATFINLEEKGVDVVSAPGGEHRFHCWPGKKHVIPEWLIKYHDEQCTVPVIKGVKNAEGNTIPTKVGEEKRFLWQVHGDAPADAPFGVVIEELVPA